mgnify:CR=1 FL=1
MKILTKDTWQIIRQNWKNILLFELLYRGITTPVYMRLVSRGIRLALRAAGYSYLTPANIGNFLIQPVTLLAFAAAAFVGILILSLETAGLVTAFQGSAYYQKLTPLHILWGGLQKMKDEMEKRNWQLPLFLAAQYLLIHLPFILRTIVRYKPANFIFQELKKQPVAVTFLIILLIFGILAVIPRSLTVYGCMIEQKHFHSGVVRSWQQFFSPDGSKIVLAWAPSAEETDQWNLSVVDLSTGEASMVDLPEMTFPVTITNEETGETSEETKNAELLLVKWQDDSNLVVLGSLQNYSTTQAPYIWLYTLP